MGDPKAKKPEDSRPNAVWNWIKETGRAAIESTSVLLKKLEAPDLKVEDDTKSELRLKSDRDSGGGYDPYNQKSVPRKPLKRK